MKGARGGGAIFRKVFDSRSLFFAPKPHENACYAGYFGASTLPRGDLPMALFLA